MNKKCFIVYEYAYKCLLDLFAKFRKKYTEINQTNDSLKLCVENDFFLYSCIEFFRLPNFSKNFNVDEIN